MRQRDIGGIIDNIKYVLKTHNQGIGQYARWIWQNKEKSRSLLPSEYGCADAANILYTIGEFPKDAEERSAWVQTLQSFQNPKTGLFQEPTHHFIHTTAHCAAALELFDADCKYPMHDLMQYTDIQALYGLLDGLDWKHDPWSRRNLCGAGAYKCGGQQVARQLFCLAEAGSRSRNGAVEIGLRERGKRACVAPYGRQFSLSV